TTVVRKTLSPQTTGADQPRPGTSAFQTTFFVAPHSSGSVLPSATPALLPPRNWVQLSSAAAPAASASVRARGPLRSMIAPYQPGSAFETSQAHHTDSPQGLVRTASLRLSGNGSGPDTASRGRRV